MGTQAGQGMTEYIIIIALIAIAAIGVYSFFGQTVNPPAPATAQGPSGKAGAKDGPPVQPPAGQPAAKSDAKGAADAKSAGVTK